MSRDGMHSVETTFDIHQLRARILFGLVGRFAPYRRLAASIFLSATGFIVIADGSAWRIAATLLGAGLALGIDRALSSQERVWRDPDRATSQDTTKWRVGVPFVITLHALVVFATGGLFSPLLVVFFVPVTLAALYDEPRVGRRVLLVQLASIWTYAAIHLFTSIDVVPKSLAWGHVEPTPASVLVVGVITSTVLVLAHLMASHGRFVFDQQLGHLLRARDVALSTLADKTQELTTLSGEIAHELKNPLSSVKGLAALLDRELPSRAAERMAVMRREIDRMQTILDEFLNFSRPLVPLTIRRIPLLGIAHEVRDLHEGVQIHRGVDIEVESTTHTEVECDPRKVKQIVVNLVQNALEVAPPATKIEIRLRVDDDAVALEVLDRGPGLDDSAVGRFFDPGVTTKASGSGLGLTVARAIAHQHGGELTLVPREPGPGARAILRLPRHQPVADAEVA